MIEPGPTQAGCGFNHRASWLLWKDREDLPDTEVRTDTVLDQGNHNKGLQEPLLLWCRYCIIFSMKYVSLSQTIQLLGHRGTTGTTATFLHLPCSPTREAGQIQQLLSCWDSGPGNSEPFISDVCRAGGKCCRAQASVMAILAATCLTAQYAQAPPQCLASVKRASWSVCKHSAVGLRHSFLSFPRQNSGSNCICYEVCSSLYFSTPPIVRQITDLITVFQRRTRNIMALRYTLILRFITISEMLKCKKEKNI